MVIAAIQTIFAQPDAPAVAEQFDRIVATLSTQFPDVARMLTDAKQDLLAFTPPTVIIQDRGPRDQTEQSVRRRSARCRSRCLCGKSRYALTACQRTHSCRA
jgi:Transposase, Mutator family